MAVRASVLVEMSRRLLNRLLENVKLRHFGAEPVFILVLKVNLGIIKGSWCLKLGPICHRIWNSLLIFNPDEKLFVTAALFYTPTSAVCY